MNSLYEICTGAIGESYERAYAWAPDEATALDLFRKSKQRSYREMSINLLFSAEAMPFVTRVSDCGF